MTAPENIRKLVETFEQNLGEYHTYKNLSSAKTPHRESVGKESMQTQVESTDGAIDRLVYELYWLNEEEIRIVES